MFQRIFDFFVKTVDSDSTSYSPTAAGYVLLFLVVVLIFLAMTALAGSNRKVNVKQLAFTAMAVTLAVVTSYLKFAQLPYGGSITLFSMFFICLAGYLFGTRVGIMTGVAYGLINLILGPSIYYPVQVLLDYPIAFGCLGLSGLFSKSKFGIIEGYVLGVFGRYIAHFLSGILFFYMYTPQGWNVGIYSLWYNALYIVPEAIATILILCIPAVRSALNQVKRMARE